MNAAQAPPKSIGAFLRAEPERFYEWIVFRQGWLVGFCIVAIVVGAGSYGAATGSWRNATQALYTGVKLPLVILLTTLANGLLNGMLAPLLGLNITFPVTAMVLGALSPVAWFIVWNTPPLSGGTKISSPEYALLQLTLAVVVALASVLGNLRLVPLLRQWAGSASVARNVLLAWLAGNLFLGSQICWVLRPFIWEANRPVEFIGQHCFQGSFFETVFQAARRLMFS